MKDEERRTYQIIVGGQLSDLRHCTGSKV